MVDTPFDAFIIGFKSLNLTQGLPLYIGTLNPTINNQIILSNYMHGNHVSLPIELPFVQVAIYHENQQTAKDIAWTIYRTLHRKVEWQIATTSWQFRAIYAKNGPYAMPAEKVTNTYRYWYVINFICYTAG